MTERLPFVSISNEQIFDEVTALRRDVNAMAGNTPQLTDHETRIRSLERRWYSLPASVLGFAFGTADMIWRLIHG